MTVNVDRTRAQAIGLTQKDVAQSLLVALSGSFQTTPSFYLDPRNGVSYNVAIQAPQYSARLAGRAEEPARHRRTSATQASRRRGRRTGAPGAQRADAGPGQPGLHHARRRTGHRQPLRCSAGHRHLCQRGWNRPGHRDRKPWKRSSPAPEERRSAPRLALRSCAARARP